MTSYELELSKAERAVLNGVLEGYGNIEIAGDLGLSDKTVKNHLAHIFAKTGTNSRLDLTVKVYKERLSRAIASKKQNKPRARRAY
jgi:DNA-binding NarL/FixJ family response regulator